MGEVTEADGTRWIGRLSQTGRARVEGRLDRLNEWTDERPERRGLADFFIALYQRDKDAFAAVLGSAIALRIFLFIIPLVVALAGLIDLLNATGLARELVGQTGLHGSVADEIESAVTTSNRSGLGSLIGGTVLTVWAGRSLTKVLVAASAAAWQRPARTIRTSVRTVFTVTMLMAGLLVANSLLSRARDSGGVALTLGALAASAAVYGVTWFGVCYAVPKATTDPGALLPGSTLFGVSVSALGWWMHFYLPGQIERASETMGSLAFAVSTLGYLFFVGRIATTSFVLNSVMWERVGSVSTFVFSLPGIRALPKRSPRLRSFFDLGQLDDDGTGNPVVAGEIAGGSPPGAG